MSFDIGKTRPLLSPPWMVGDGSLPDELDQVRDELLQWYAEHKREFPWRDTTDAYQILVSEVMSQQTQLTRVTDAWRAFLDRWPTVTALAAADRGEVIGFWSSKRLGYNNRARYLHEAAEQIESEFNGSVPSTPKELETLQGVGPYTANAVASFAFNTGNAVVDTNVKRVLYRAFQVPDSESAYETVANELLPEGSSREWNNAMMELGALACQKTPACDEQQCPLRRWCSAYKTGDFTAPDVPTQPSFEGSRRQYRGRIIRVIEAKGKMNLQELGPRIKIDYTPTDREWLEGIITDLADEGLIESNEEDNEQMVALPES